MYLLFETIGRTIHCATFSDEGELIYEQTYSVEAWTPKSVNAVFAAQIVPKLRAHGALFTKIGLVIPFADPKHTEPTLASAKLMHELNNTPLRQKIMTPIDLIMRSSQKAWPHLPHCFLFDTCLSQHLTRDTVLPPFDYETAKTLHIHPVLLHSYGHKANIMKLRSKKTVAISVYIGQQTSVALFEGETVKDACVSYSPLSSLLSLTSPGSFDPGFYLELAQKKNSAAMLALVTEKSGLQPMTETKFDLETLLQIAGLTGRSESFSIDDYSIETIEWIELSLLNYLRSLRHAIGALRTDYADVHTIVANTSTINASSKFWTLLTKAGLQDMKVVLSDVPLLQAACQDLMR